MPRTVTLEDLDRARARLVAQGKIDENDRPARSRVRPRDAEKLASLKAITEIRTEGMRFHLDETGRRVFDIGLLPR